MLYNLIFKPQKDIKYEQRNQHLHSIFSNIFHEKNKENTKKRNYSFFIERKKTYFKNKSYKIQLHIGDEFLNQLFHKNVKKWKEIIKVEEKELNISTFLEIKDLKFRILDTVLKNWDIEKKEKYNEYNSSYGKDLLKELIEFQVNLNSNLTMKPNKKTKHGKDYFSFIKNIFIQDTNQTNTYDILIEIENTKQAKLLAREIVYKGAGTNQSFGHGYTTFKKGLI
jgi:hypothetical protein